MSEQDDAPDVAKLREAARKASTTEEYRKRFWRIDHVMPYAKQKTLFAFGATRRERLFKSGNQVGKSWALCLEGSYHLTGRYPPWWEGRRFDGPINALVCSETTILTRDVAQRHLFGPAGSPDELGTGLIPLELLGKISLAVGIRDAYDTVRIKHVSGGWSSVRFISYAAGRQAFQGLTLHLVLCDEEPPADVYSEALTRISATRGIVMIGYTPMGGPGEVTRRFTEADDTDRAIVKMSLYDVANEPNGHLTVEDVETIKRNCPPHEVRTRVYGEDMQGEGSVFPIEEAVITEPPLTYIPDHWQKLWALDFGISHAFAAVLLLYDVDADVVHVHHCIRLRNQTPLQHAVPMKAIGADTPVVYPKDGDNREQGSGQQLSDLYRDQQLRMMPKYATWPDGSVSTERGIFEMWTRMSTGRFKVAKHLAEWFEEFRGYHRKDGQIVKLYDDLMSATRVGIMGLRHARSGPLGSRRPPPGHRGPQVARDLDFDPF